MQARNYEDLINQMAERMFMAWVNKEMADGAKDSNSKRYFREVASEYDALWHEMEMAIKFCFELEEDRSPFCEALDLAGARWDKYIKTNLIFS